MPIRDRFVTCALAVGLLQFTVMLPAGAAPRKMFVTSATGTGSLGDWAVIANEGFSGVAAGDEICRRLASGAALVNADNYRAWLSDEIDDAFCRVRSIDGGGSRASDCGGGSLLLAAGPWARADGSPFAADQFAMLDDRAVYLPALLDENGSAVSGSPVWTATTSSGEFSGAYCQGWSNATDESTGTAGFAVRTGSYFTNVGAYQCLLPSRLLCFETGLAGEPLLFPESEGALAFLTSASDHGNLGAWDQANGKLGIAAGDEICRTLAEHAHLPTADSFHAWLGTTASSARSRLAFAGPWKRLDGLEIASSVADLTDGTLATGLNLTDALTYTDDEAWTGSGFTGAATKIDCLEWTSASSETNGTSGISADTRPSWSNSAPVACSSTRHLYCLGSDPVLFWDGFEAGSSARWSSSEP